MRVMVVAVRFPSPIQPWLLNQIAQVFRHGGSVEIVARGPDGESYPRMVDELGLLARTHYFTAPSISVALRELGSLLAVNDRGRAARTGLRRLSRSDWRPEGLKAWVKTLARIRVLAIDGLDLVHAHSLRFAYDYMHVAHINRVPLILTFHGRTAAGTGLLAPAKRRRLFQALDLALVNTEFAGAQLEAIGCPSHKIEILPQGIRLEDHRFEPMGAPEHGPLRLLSVSRLDTDKGIDYAIEAVKASVNRGLDVHYVIVGSGADEDRLRSQIRRLGLTDRVSLAGRLTGSALRDQYRVAHVLLLPSLANGLEEWNETQGVVMQEAQACGVLVAASRAGGIPECVDEGSSAFLFADRDSDAIADVIQEIMNRPEEWSTWQERGRCWVERHFDIDRLGNRLIELYAAKIAEREELRERQ